jgi:hypothetical protein
MPEASSTDFAPAGTPSEAADVRQDIWTLSPAEAGEILAERAADFAPQALTAEQVQDATDARIRLTQLTNDPVWAKKYMEGSPDEKREFEALTQQIADAGEGAPFMETPIEMTVGDQSVRRQDLISALSHLGGLGIPAEGIERIVTGEWSDEDVGWAQQLLDRGMATPEWTNALLRGDPAAVHEWTALCGVLSARKVT